MSLNPMPEVTAQVANDIRHEVTPHLAEHLAAVADAVEAADVDRLAFEMVDFIQCLSQISEALKVLAVTLDLESEAEVVRQVGSFDMPDSPDEIAEVEALAPQRRAMISHG